MPGILLLGAHPFLYGIELSTKPFQALVARHEYSCSRFLKPL